MRSYKVTAIVLRRADVGETDKILTLFSRECGKIPAIAKGARKPISRIAGASELLTVGRYALAVGRSLDVVTQVEVGESFSGIRRDIRKAGYASYILELTDLLTTEHEPNPDLFDLLLQALYVLQTGGNGEVIARGFDLSAMALLGYKPQLDACVRCGKGSLGSEQHFSPSAGGIVCSQCGILPDDAIPISRAEIAAMRRLSNSEPPDWRRLRFARDVGERLANLMKWYIRYRTDREVRSAGFVDRLKAQS